MVILEQVFGFCQKKLTNFISRIYVRMGLMALITAIVLCARSQDSLLTVLARTVHVVFSTVRLRGGGKPCRTLRETAALRRAEILLT